MTNTDNLKNPKEELIKEIDHAFDGVKLGNGVGLFEAQAIDDYEPDDRVAEMRLGDEKDDWRKITAKDINRCGTSPSFFDSEGMRFHLPALMLYEINQSEYEDLEFDGPDLIFHLQSAVSGGSYSSEQFSLLNERQTQCVISFIEYCLSTIYKDQVDELSQLADRWKSL